MAGSITNLSNIRENLKQQQLTRQAEDEKARKEKSAQDKAESSASDTATAATDTPAKAPEMYTSAIHGAITVARLLELYPDIVRQVKDKSYWTVGTASYSFSGGGRVVEFKTLTKAEARLLVALIEYNAQDGVQTFMVDDMLRQRLIFSMTSFGAETLRPLKVVEVSYGAPFRTLVRESLMEFVKTPEYRKRADLVDALALPVFSTLANYCYDAEAAFQYAIAEDMRNP